MRVSGNSMQNNRATALGVALVRGFGVGVAGLISPELDRRVATSPLAGLLKDTFFMQITNIPHTH